MGWETNRWIRFDSCQLAKLNYKLAYSAVHFIFVDVRVDIDTLKALIAFLF